MGGSNRVRDLMMIREKRHAVVEYNGKYLSNYANISNELVWDDLDKAVQYPESTSQKYAPHQLVAMMCPYFEDLCNARWRIVLERFERTVLE